jgi:hypothetical protein
VCINCNFDYVLCLVCLVCICVCVCVCVRGNSLGFNKVQQKESESVSVPKVCILVMFQTYYLVGLLLLLLFVLLCGVVLGRAVQLHSGGEEGDGGVNKLH